MTSNTSDVDPSSTPSRPIGETKRTHSREGGICEVNYRLVDTFLAIRIFALMVIAIGLMVVWGISLQSGFPIIYPSPIQLSHPTEATTNNPWIREVLLLFATSYLLGVFIDMRLYLLSLETRFARIYKSITRPRPNEERSHPKKKVFRKFGLFPEQILSNAITFLILYVMGFALASWLIIIGGRFLGPNGEAMFPENYFSSNLARSGSYLHKLLLLIPILYGASFIVIGIEVLSAFVSYLWEIRLSFQVYNYDPSPFVGPPTAPKFIGRYIQAKAPKFRL